MTEAREKQVAIDFHNHVLGHKYYFKGYTPTTIDDEDKITIQEFLHDACYRGLDYVAVTDHDMLASALYAREYAKENGLKIKVIPGVECEVMHFKERIHILALGIEEMPEYMLSTDPVQLIKRIQALGGKAVLAHPHMYSIYPYHNLKKYLDGVEYYNGGCASRGDGERWTLMDDEGSTLLKTYGSDYHYPKKMPPVQDRGYNYYNESLAIELAGY